MPGLNKSDTDRVHITPVLIADGCGDSTWRIRPNVLRTHDIAKRGALL